VAVLVGVGEAGGGFVWVGRGVLGRRVAVGAGMVAEGGTGVGKADFWVLADCGLRVAGGRTGNEMAVEVADAVGNAVSEAAVVTLDVGVGVIVKSAVDQYAPVTTI